MHNKLFNYFNFFIKLLLGHLKDVMKKISFYNLHWAEEWQETFRLVFLKSFNKSNQRKSHSVGKCELVSG